MNTSMIIRPMTEQDWPQVAAIYEQGIVSHKATFAVLCWRVLALT